MLFTKIEFNAHIERNRQQTYIIRRYNERIKQRTNFSAFLNSSEILTKIQDQLLQQKKNKSKVQALFDLTNIAFEDWVNITKCCI